LTMIAPFWLVLPKRIDARVPATTQSSYQQIVL
jgi:hypothetical protein